MENKTKILERIVKNNHIPIDIYQEQNIRKGLRYASGQGILVGITKVSALYGNENSIPCKGKILYRGYNLDDLLEQKDICFEKICFLLQIGSMPTSEEWLEYHKQVVLNKKHFLYLLRNKYDLILRYQNSEKLSIENLTARMILALYDDDNNPNEISLANSYRQGIFITANMGILSSWLYKKKYDSAYQLTDNDIDYIANSSTAENILYILKGENNYSKNEIEILDECLILHADLGASNNSCFTAQVVTSAGTDTYSSIAAAICSIKGIKHGGANRKAFQMIKYIQKDLGNKPNDSELEKELSDIANGISFDQKGLIYGIGHAEFTLSDPRAEQFRKIAENLAQKNNCQQAFSLYRRIEKIAPKVIQKIKKVNKPICTNVDFYSGFIYDMLCIPEEMFTPMFINARTAGWVAHRLEEQCNEQRIIHPRFSFLF